MGKVQEDFLERAVQAAGRAGHVFPAYAACEAALESAWGMSKLAVEGNNLFGQKQSHPPLPGTSTLALPTREYLHGAWVSVPAQWTRFADWEACFNARMALLERLGREYPAYAAALAAKTGEDFITLVSQRWSTDPGRAGKVLEVHDCHRECLSQLALA